MDPSIRNRYQLPPTKITTTRPKLNFKPKPDLNHTQRIPYKAIILTMFLFTLGSLLLLLSFRIYRGHHTREYDDRFIPALILGLICFIPGSYYMVIIVYICLGYTELSYSDIHSVID